MEPRIRQALSRHLGPEAADAARLENLGGHASLRIYWRVHLSRPEPARRERTLMAMVLPEGVDPTRSEEGGSSADAPSTELSFVNVHRFLSFLDMPIPQIDRVDMDLGVLLTEDLGDVRFEDRYLEIARDFGAHTPSGRDEIARLYHGAIDLLVDLQRSIKQYEYVDADAPRTPKCVAWDKGFDRELLRWELDHYREWGLEAQHGPLDEADRATLDTIFDRLTDALLNVRTTFCLRDYQSRNIMEKHDRFFIIDFQDALRGAVVYDLVALLRDSYIELPPDLVRALVEHYTRQGYAAGLGWCRDEDEVMRAFHLQTVQRKLKDAGRFIFIDRVKNNPDFLPYYDASIRYVRDALLELPDFADLSALLDRIEPAWRAEDPTPAHHASAPIPFTVWSEEE